MVTHRVAQPLVFGIGHYLGPLHLPDGEPRVHQVRRGPNIEELPEDRFVVWALANGLADRLETRWTRQFVEQTAQQAGLAKPRAIMDELLAEEFAVEVAPDSEQAREFSLAYQVHPLMLGLGNSSEEPWLYGIGFGDQPILRVTRAVYGLWEWAHLEDNLWDACVSFTDVERDAGGTDPELTDPQRVLTGLLEGLHHMTATTAAYLDLAQNQPAVR